MFLTTHYMDEAENLADRIAVIAGGRIVAEGTPGTLGGRDRMAATIRFTLPGGHRASASCRTRSGRWPTPGADGAVALRTRRAARPASGTSPSGRSRATWTCRTSRCARPTLEDVYLSAAPQAAGGGARDPRRRGSCSHQARYDLLGFLRNRQARFFTLVLPLIFLVIFVSVFGNHTVGPEHVKASTYYVPGPVGARDHRRLVREPRDLAHRAAGGGRAQAPPGDAGAGVGADRRAHADRDGHLARSS